MTAESRQPYSNRGGIETTMGARLHPGIVDDFYESRIDVEPLDPEKSDKARNEMNRLYRYEPSVVCDKYGYTWFQIITPSKRHHNRGQLMEEWVETEDIFDARDRILQIVGSYSEGGEQYNRRTLAAKTISTVVDRLQEGPLTDEEAGVLRDKILTNMIDAKYPASFYPARVLTATDLVRATERDSKGRQNNPRGRVIGNARRPQAIKDGLVAGRILKKNRRRLTVVEAVCDLIEQDFANIERFAQDLSENKIGTGDFELELPRFRRTVSLLLSPEVVVLPKPYSELGATIRYALHPTHQIGDAITLSRYMDPFKALDVTDKFKKGFDQIESPERKARIIDLTNIIAEERKAIALKRFGEEAA